MIFIGRRLPYSSPAYRHGGMGWGTKRYLNMKPLYEMEKENELKREQEKDGNVA